jgi:hypothetical protein
MIEFDTDVKKAERVVERLSQSHKDLLTRAEELSAERAALSFAALAEADEASQAKLKKLNAEITNIFAQQAIDMDAALQSVATIGNAMQETLTTIHSLGASHPTHIQLQTLGSTALKTALMATPFRVEHIAPLERRSFCDLFVHWIAMLDRHVAQFIGPERPEQDAAA